MVDVPDQPPVRLVDSRRSAFVSFAPPDPDPLGPRRRSPARAPIEVGAERAMIADPSRDAADVGAGVTYPIQPGKVQAPALRDETLARTRLLDWLDVKIHRRLIFVIADAGYGKTTLLADFSRRTRLRTIWYRLDEEDRDWVGFLAHLVAAGREHDPGFAPRTASILRSLEPGGPSREDAVETFLDELPSIARDGAALILDDFHLADEVGDIRTIVREIVVRGPERLSIVFASRRVPSIPVAKLRSLGELAELGIADLRFSDSELEQLFRETYGRPLEPDVLAELAQRTEGWAASLTLVQAALRERTPAETRSFVRGLSGARDELHDYLAEEVVGDLPAIQQQFLMRTSLLQRVTPELAQVATGLDAVEVQSMIAEAERLGLLGRRAKRRSSEQRYHPLVREFLEDRLRREIGPAGINNLHVTIAKWAEPSDWRTAAHHYAEASQALDLARVLDASIQTIVAVGAVASALEIVGRVPEIPDSAAIVILRSRTATATGDVQQTIRLARRAVELDPDNEVAVGNLLSANVLAGEMVEGRRLAKQLAESARDPLVREIAEAAAVLIDTSLDYDLKEARALFEGMAVRFHAANQPHYEGISWLNAAIVNRARGALDQSLANAAKAIDALSTTASVNELASASFAKGTATAMLGDVQQARQIFYAAGSSLRHASRVEYLAELAEMEAMFGSAEEAERLLREVDPSVTHGMAHVTHLVEALLLIRKSQPQAVDVLDGISRTTPVPESGYQSHAAALRAIAHAMVRDHAASDVCTEAVRIADRQNAGLWREVASLALAYGTGRLSTAVLAVPPAMRCAVSIAAELVAWGASTLDDQALDVLRAEVAPRRERWLPTLRSVARDAAAPSRLPCARLLDELGLRDDIPFLRRVARSARSGPDRELGRGLARRLAEPVLVRDLGRVQVVVGSRVVEGSDIRRKVLALLVYLVSRPGLSATREEVMDALWPDQAPPAATNSLNQTVYFLRRVLEPEYSEDTSPGYLRQDSELLWLDQGLVEAESAACLNLIAALDRAPNSELARAISRTYRGRFALDFTYEEWAADYREWLHVAYLRCVEREIERDIESGQFAVGLEIAQRALEVDPRHEPLERSLVRLLKGAGAHSAAAEQYARYANVVRQDLGIEVEPSDPA